MITDAVLSIVADVIRSVLGLLPAIRLPSWAVPGGALESGAASIGARLGGLGSWLPGTALSTVYGAIIFVLGVAALIRIIRMLASLLTGGGGSAA